MSGEKVTLIVYPEDNSEFIEWGGYEVEGIGETSVSDGRENTSIITQAIGSGHYAANLCNELSALGHDDWYLPARDELNCIFHQKKAVGGLTTFDYWTSTEHPEYNPWGQYLNHGFQFNGSRNGAAHVRCVRREAIGKVEK
jgi:hypothetical protein